MHVLEPKEIALHKKRVHSAKKRSKKIKAIIVIILVVSLAGATWFVLTNQLTKKSSQPIETTTQPENTKTPEPTVQTPKTTIKKFSSIEFRDLYRSIIYPNTQGFVTLPEITGNSTADARIRLLAEKRGFVPTSIPVAPIEKSGEAMTGAYQDDLIQPLAAKSWQQLKAASKTEGVSMSLLSAYRSPKSQRDLFTERLYSTGITAEKIAAGSGDDAVNITLGLTAVPGYSRHHTGYTIDIFCDDGVAFPDSKCNKWITKDNYANAKKYGWIPSYPPGAGEQGPEPEAWEYVWVGTDLLYE